MRIRPFYVLLCPCCGEIIKVKKLGVGKNT